MFTIVYFQAALFVPQPEIKKSLYIIIMGGNSFKIKVVLWDKEQNRHPA